MNSGILQRRTDVCLTTLLPIFKDVMESATFGHDRLEILSITQILMFCSILSSLRKSGREVT